MNILAIDTTSTGLSIALVKNGEMFSYTKEIGKSGHSATLMPSVKAMLDEHEVDVNDIDVIGVVVGPGSFTGIRIGVSAMTALAFATGAKRIAITAFETRLYRRRRRRTWQLVSRRVQKRQSREAILCRKRAKRLFRCRKNRF